MPHTLPPSARYSAPTLSALQRSRTGLRGGGPGRRHLLMFTARSDCVWAGHTPGLLLLPPLTSCTPRQAKERREGGRRKSRWTPFILNCVGMAILLHEQNLFDTFCRNPKLRAKGCQACVWVSWVPPRPLCVKGRSVSAGSWWSIAAVVSQSSSAFQMYSLQMKPHWPGATVQLSFMCVYIFV